MEHIGATSVVDPLSQRTMCWRQPTACLRPRPRGSWWWWPGTRCGTWGSRGRLDIGCAAWPGTRHTGRRVSGTGLIGNMWVIFVGAISTNISTLSCYLLLNTRSYWQTGRGHFYSVCDTSPGLRSGTNDHDLALLHLCSPLSWRPQVQPVCLPQAELIYDDADHGYEGVSALVSGWGTTSSGQKKLNLNGRNSTWTIDDWVEKEDL